MLADVAQPGSSKERIGDCMAHHVGIGMSRQPASEGDSQPAKYQRSSFAQPVSVVPDPYPHA
jgi:hypothetical protein